MFLFVSLFHKLAKGNPPFLEKNEKFLRKFYKIQKFNNLNK